MMAVSSFSLIAQSIPEESLYLGQTPPGSTPQIFNLSITNGHRACERIAISSDGKEIYYGELNTYPPTSYRVRCFKYQNNKWQGPFNLFEGFTAPSLSMNDSIIYLQNNIFYTYYSVRTDSGWSVPAKLLSGNQRTHYFQRTNLYNTYASSYYEGSPLDGNISKLIVVNQDTILQSLGIPLNSPQQENDFYISRNESYIFFSKNVNGGAGDIYISFKKDNGKWTNPKNLGEPINKPGYNWEYGQFVSVDGKYLFYTSGSTTMSSYYTYWVRIDDFLDSLRHTNFTPYLNYQIPNQTGLIGQSFFYTVSDSVFIDDDGNNTLAYSSKLSNGNPLPAWLFFDPITRTFTGTPTSVVNLAVKVTASDNANASAACTFNINVAVTGIEDDQGNIPTDLNLHQNYPNPFNPTTTIEFAVPKAGRYTLNLYNILGQLVKKISDKEYDAGYYKENLDANGLSSGTYIYKLRGDAAEVVRKMVLIQ